MGDPVSRIESEYILTIVSEKQIKITVYIGKDQFTGGVVGFTRNEVEISVNEEALKKAEPKKNVRIYFEYFGHIMTFTTKVVKCDETLVLDYPERMHKNLKRKFHRMMNPDGISLSFKINEKKIELNFPESESFESIDDPPQTNDFNLKRIDELVVRFREKMNAEKIKNKIQMFREKKPETVEELILANSGKTIYLPVIEKGFPESDDFLIGKTVTKQFIDMISSGLFSYFIEEERIRDFLQNKIDNGVFSCLYCPILYHQYVIGYISLEHDRSLSIDVLDYTVQFTKVLAYALREHGYFEGDKMVESEYDAQIIDISASGILVAHNKNLLSLVLSVYSDIEIVLRAGKRTMVLQSRIMRAFEDKKLIYYGLQFMNIKPEDFRFLFEFVYGKEYVDEENITWEGGTPPPELQL